MPKQRIKMYFKSVAYGLNIKLIGKNWHHLKSLVKQVMFGVGKLSKVDSELNDNVTYGSL